MCGWTRFCQNRSPCPLPLACPAPHYCQNLCTCIANLNKHRGITALQWINRWKFRAWWLTSSYWHYLNNQGKQNDEHGSWFLLWDRVNIINWKYKLPCFKAGNLYFHSCDNPFPEILPLKKKLGLRAVLSFPKTESILSQVWSLFMRAGGKISSALFRGRCLGKFLNSSPLMFIFMFPN